jgi:hypothetical protein
VVEAMVAMATELSAFFFFYFLSSSEQETQLAMETCTTSMVKPTTAI